MFKKTLKGRIAHLPVQIRYQVCKRIHKGELPGITALWLNNQFAVLEILEEKFQDEPITERDIQEWKDGGFLDWLPSTDFTEYAVAACADASELRASGLTTEHLFMSVVARHAQLLCAMGVVPDDLVARRMAGLERATRSVLLLCKREDAKERLQLERERLKLARERQRTKSNSSSKSSASSPALSSDENASPKEAAQSRVSPLRPKPSGRVGILPADVGVPPTLSPVSANGSNGKSIPSPHVDSHPAPSDYLDSNSECVAIPANAALPDTGMHSNSKNPPSSRNGTPSTASPRNRFGLV